MKKKLLVLCIAAATVLLCIGLAACGENGNGEGVRVTFEANGGVFADGSDSFSVRVLPSEAQNIEIPECTLEGNVLLGWDHEGDFWTESRIHEDFYPRRDLTFTAVWHEAVEFIFNANGGYFASEETVEISVNIPKDTYITMADYLKGTEPVRSDYTFEEWYYYDADGEVQTYLDFRFSEGYTVYAKWLYTPENCVRLPAPSLAVYRERVIWDDIGATAYEYVIYENSYEIRSETTRCCAVSLAGYGDANYTVKVRAGDGIKTINSDWREISVITGRLSAVRVSLDLESALLSWTDTDTKYGEADRYELSVYGEEAGEEPLYCETLSEASFDMSACQAGSYRICITSMRDGYASAATEATVIKYRLADPELLSAEYNADGSLALCWNAVNHADEYVLSYCGNIIEALPAVPEESGAYTCVIDKSKLEQYEEGGCVVLCAFDSEHNYLISAGVEISL